MYGFLDAPKNHFEKYNSDVFGVHKTQWCWHYEWRAFERKFVIADLKPVCKQCGTTMDIDNSFYSYNAECHKCKLEGRQYRFPLTEDITDIEKEIIRKIG